MCVIGKKHSKHEIQTGRPLRQTRLSRGQDRLTRKRNTDTFLQKLNRYSKPSSKNILDSSRSTPCHQDPYLLAGTGVERVRRGVNALHLVKHHPLVCERVVLVLQLVMPPFLLHHLLMTPPPHTHTSAHRSWQSHECSIANARTRSTASVVVVQRGPGKLAAA